MAIYESDKGMVGFFDPALGAQWLSAASVNGLVMLAISDITDESAEPEWFAMDAEMVSHLSNYLLEWQIKNTIGE